MRDTLARPMPPNVVPRPGVAVEEAEEPGALSTPCDYEDKTASFPPAAGIHRVRVMTDGGAIR